MAGMFPQAGRWASGYDRTQVDAFLKRARTAYEGSGGMTAEDVRGAAFDLVRHGYAPEAVDAALDRLEGAFVQRERTDRVETEGQEHWMDEVADRATTLYPRLTRPAGERFAPPERGRGYEREAVDAVLERIVDYFDSGRPLTSAQLRSVTFPAARRSRAYGEGPVDAFLDRAVDVLIAVE